MNTINLKITTKDKKIELAVNPDFKAFSELFEYLKNALGIVNDFDIFVKMNNEKDQPRLLTEANFKKDFILLNQNTVQLIIFENPNLDTQIQSIITEYEYKSTEKKKIDGLSVLASNSKVIESKWINSEEISSKPKKIFTDKCSFCKAEITSLKFICWICDDSIICDKCEVSHDHPVIKYKSLLFSEGIDDMLNYKTSKEKKQWNMFKKEIELTSSVNYTVKTQLYKEVTIPILIKWNGNHNEAFTVIIKNYRDLQVKYSLEDINTEEVSNLYITITPKQYSIANYCIGVLLTPKGANKISNVLNINLEVNEDSEDEELNEYFVNYPNIVILPKKYKQLIAMTFKEKLSGKTINEIYAILKLHQWKMESAIEDLTQEQSSN